ncbi:hypothetical protein ACFL00_00295 [Pseudomonadota bacterium]
MEAVIKIISQIPLAVVFGLTTILLAIVTIRLRREQLQFQKLVENEKGTFKKPSLSISFSGHDAVGRVILAVPFDGNFWEIPLAITVKNNGDKLAKNVEVMIRAHKSLLYDGAAELDLKPGIKTVRTQSNLQGPFVTTLASFSDIHPKQDLLLNLPMSFSSGTIFLHDVHATTRDNVDVVMKMWVGLSLPLDIVVSHEEGIPISTRVSLQTIDTSTLKIHEFFRAYHEAIDRRDGDFGATMKLWKKNKSKARAKLFLEQLQLLTVQQDKVKKKVYGKKSRKLTVNEVQKEDLVRHTGFVSKNKFFLIPGITVEKQ